MSLRTQIYVSGTTIDLLEDISIPMTYSIADVREPQKRTTNYSKTIILPGTRVNNVLFAHLFDVHTSVGTSGTTAYNPNLKAPVSVLIDGAEVFTGFIQLNHINVTNHYGIEYECTMFGNLANIFQTLGDKRLSQIDLSAYNHTLNLPTQVASWDTSIKKNGANYSNFSGGLPIGEGYVYPMIDYGYSNGMSFRIDEFFPAVYVKTIIDGIFNQAGFQYQSSFFNSQLFKSLVIPYSSGNLLLSNSQMQSAGFRASKNAIQSLTFPSALKSVISFQDETTPPNYDPANNYDNVTLFSFRPPKYGTYDINATLEFDLTHFPLSSTVTYPPTFNHILGYVSIVNSNFPNSPVGVRQIAFYGGTNAGNSVNPGDCNFIYNSATLTSGTTNCTVTCKVGIQLTLATGDTIHIQVETISGTDIYGTSTGHTLINIKPSSFFTITLADNRVKEGDTVIMNNVLPDNIKQADFLTSIIKAFNLYIDNDKTISNKLIIEPRDDFYASGTTKDWSTKLDYSQSVTITPLGELDNKIYEFKFKEDEDYYNATYKNKWHEEYGYKKYSVSNDFIKNETTIELIFSPTPLADYIGVDRVIPKIFSLDSSGTVSPKTSNLRLLYYGGVKATGNTWGYVSSSGTTNYTTYPYAGHLDDVSSPTIDLNFDSPREVFYTATAYTSNNLFNKYWSKYLAQITDKDSKFVTGHFNLNATDIAGLSFFDVFYFENDFFILNKIYDYNPTQNELTKCEFVKLIEYPAFVSETLTTYGGVANFTLGGSVPVYANRTTQNNNAQRFNNPTGINNFISPETNGCSITGGIFSYISPGCTNVNLINTSGVTVYGGVNNVTVMNTSGTTVMTSNQVIINGLVMSDPLQPNTYIPSITNLVNVDSATPYQCQFYRVGNLVTVSGQVDIDATTTATPTQIQMSLPIASVFTSTGNLGGSAFNGATQGEGVAIFANTSNYTALFAYNCVSTVSRSFAFSFTYLVI